MTDNIITFTVPAWAQPYIEYGEDVVLTQQEKDIIDVFLSDVATQHGEGHWSWPDDDEEPFFTSCNDIDDLGSTCITAQYVPKLKNLCTMLHCPFTDPKNGCRRFVSALHCHVAVAAPEVAAVSSEYWLYARSFTPEIRAAYYKMRSSEHSMRQLWMEHISAPEPSPPRLTLTNYCLIELREQDDDTVICIFKHSSGAFTKVPSALTLRKMQDWLGRYVNDEHYVTLKSGEVYHTILFVDNTQFVIIDGVLNLP